MTTTTATPPTTDAAPIAPPPTAKGVSQRERILDTALELMSEQGAGSTSMRQLAKACGLNVAAIYHYFPSKDDILRSVIEERQYAVQLRTLPVEPTDIPPRELLASLIVEMWRGARSEERIWRLLLGEALRGDDTARVVGEELLAAIETALDGWLATLFPDDTDRVGPAVTIITGQLFTTFMERLFRPETDDLGDVRRRADEIARLVFPD